MLNVRDRCVYGTYMMVEHIQSREYMYVNLIGYRSQPDLNSEINYFHLNSIIYLNLLHELLRLYRVR